MRVLVTGATGFAGKHLIEVLKKNDVTSIDIFGTCFPDRPSNLDRNLFHVDIRSEIEIKKLINDIKPNWVFHLAAVSSVKYSWENRKETIETNIIGTYNILESIRMFVPFSRVLFVSSSEVYKFNKIRKIAVTEKSPIEVMNPYAYSKIACELLCNIYVLVEDLDIVIARPFSHTGPGQREDFLCSNWAKQIIEIEKGKRKPIIEVGNIDVIRDYCDVRDVARAYFLLLEKGRRGDVYNVCSGKPIPLRKLLDIIVKKANLKQPIKISVSENRLRKIDYSYIVGSNKKIKKELGWEPEIKLDQTLEDLINHWRKEI